MHDRNFYPEDFLDHEVARFVDDDEPCKEIDRRSLPTDHEAWGSPEKWRIQSKAPARDASARRKTKRQLAKKARRNNRR